MHYPNKKPADGVRSVSKSNFTKSNLFHNYTSFFEGGVEERDRGCKQSSVLFTIFPFELQKVKGDR